MFDKVINILMQGILVFTVIIGVGYSPEGSTGIQARILGERAAIANAQAQGGSGRYKVLNKTFAKGEDGRIKWIVEVEKY